MRHAGLHLWYRHFFQSIFQIFTSLSNKCPLFDSFVPLLDIFIFQIVIFGHATALFSDVGTLELFAVRIGVTNSIIDPWIYILFRKENIFAITRKLGTFCDISKVTSNSVNNNVTPPTDAQTQSDGNTSARTEHSIDIII